MTAQRDLGLVWALNGGTTPTGDTKYQDGWVAEIPTYQNFNYMVQGLDQNILHLAEFNGFDWQNDIGYKVGARAFENGTYWFCITDHTNQQPSTDTTNSYWVSGSALGSFANLSETDGFRIELPEKSVNTYLGQDQTIVNTLPITVYQTTNGTAKNWGLGNQGGELVALDLGTGTSPDGRALVKGSDNSFRLFHEGHLPDISEVVDGVEESNSDDKIYGRYNGTWVEVTTTKVSDKPAPPIKGAGQGWYNLDDGQLYIDINDGDSSQWVPASPPIIPQVDAEDVSFDRTSLTDVDSALNYLLDTYVGENLLLNSGFNINRRKSLNGNNELFDFLGSGQLANYGCDMWAVASGRTIERVVGDAPSYSPTGMSLRGKIAAGGSSTNCQLRTAIETSRIGNDVSPQFPVGATFTLSFAIKNAVGESYGVFVNFADNVNNALNAVPIYSNDNVGTGTGNWEAERRSITFTIPSSAVETTTCLQIAWVGPNPVTGGDQTTFIQLADVKLERGSVATPYVAPDRIEEIAKTARYCMVISTGGTGQQVGYIDTAGKASFMIPTQSTMRTIPTYQTQNPPNLRVVYPSATSDNVEVTGISRYGNAIRIVVNKVGGGSLNTGNYSTVLQVDDSYILDASL
jgi:hypothetical protein